MAEIIPLLRAESDIQRIYNRLDQFQAGRGELFLSSVDRSFNLLRTFPGMGAPILNGYRRLLIRQFPYGIIYKEEGSRVVVYSVAPLLQDPEKLRAIIDDPTA